MGRRPRSTWLSVTPEPERELPVAVAALRAGGEPSPEQVQAERDRLERLVLHGSERSWLAYMADVVDLIEHSPQRGRVRPSPLEGGGSDPYDLGGARRVALEVVHNHHQLLLGLPGRASERTAAERRRLQTMARGEP